MSVERKSPVSSPETAPAIEKTHSCERCFLVLKDALHLTELQAGNLEQRAFFSDACVRGFHFPADVPKWQQDARREKAWKGLRALFTTWYTYVSMAPLTYRALGRTFRPFQVVASIRVL